MLFYGNHGACPLRSSILGGIGTLGGYAAEGICAAPIQVIFPFYRVSTLAEHADVIRRSTVLVAAIVGSVVTAPLVYGLHAGRTFVYHLHKVEVACRF